MKIAGVDTGASPVRQSRQSGRSLEEGECSVWMYIMQLKRGVQNAATQHRPQGVRQQWLKILGTDESARDMQVCVGHEGE